MANTDISTIILLTTLISLCGCAMIMSENKKTPIPRRILFIGNSYTGGIKNTLSKMIKDSQYADTELQFITPGGKTLAWHFEKPETQEIIKTGNWDIVVLQEQSLMPSIPGRAEESFHKAVGQFAELIKASGARPMLYMTWGRKDGRPQNNFPDYISMQTRLTEAYLGAAKRNNALVSPVGIAWSAVRKENKELGEGLYTKDGSHPSDKGAYLVSCVFLKALFNDSLESYDCPDGLTEDEWSIFKEAALQSGM